MSDKYIPPPVVNLSVPSTTGSETERLPNKGALQPGRYGLPFGLGAGELYTIARWYRLLEARSIQTSKGYLSWLESFSSEARPVSMLQVMADFKRQAKNEKNNVPNDPTKAGG